MTGILAIRCGKNLKKFIKAKNYTQEKFAFKINRDPSTIRKWIKNGINQLSVLEELSLSLGIAITEFFL